MNDENRKAIHDLVLSLEKEDTIRPFLRDLADLLEKYGIVLEVADGADFDVLRDGNVIYEMKCRWLDPGSLREEAKQ